MKVKYFLVFFINLWAVACTEIKNTPMLVDITDDAQFRVSGNEPFWTFKIANGQAVYSTPENIGGETLPVKVMKYDDRIEITGILNQETFTLKLMDTPCQNDMSGDMHDMKAFYNIDGHQYPGCADKN